LPPAACLSPWCNRNFALAPAAISCMFRRHLQDIERDNYAFDRLDELPSGLIGRYASFFERAFPSEAAYVPARVVLEVMLAAQQPSRGRRSPAPSHLTPCMH